MKVSKLVVGIDRIKSSNLNGMRRAGLEFVRLPENLVWNSIKVKPHASLSISDKEEDKNVIYTATLKFKTCAVLLDKKHFCYRVKLSDGSCILLGTNTRPYPQATVVESMPESATDNQLNEYQITYSTNSRIPAIID